MQSKLEAFSLKKLTLQDIRRSNLAFYIRLRAYPTDCLEKLMSLAAASKSNLRSIDNRNTKYLKKRKRNDDLEDLLYDIDDSKRWKDHDESSRNKVKNSRKERKKRKKSYEMQAHSTKKGEKIRARAEKRKMEKKMRMKSRVVVASV